MNSARSPDAVDVRARPPTADAPIGDGDDREVLRVLAPGALPDAAAEDTDHGDADAPPESRITPLPAPPQGVRVVDVTPVRAPFAFVRILFDEAVSAHRYEVIEPPLTPEEKQALEFVKTAFLKTLDMDFDALAKDGARTYLWHALDTLTRRHGMEMDAVTRARIGYYLERDFIGFGAIDAMMRDEHVEDVSCDGAGVPLFVFHRKYESLRSNVAFETDAALDAFVMRLVQRSGRHISLAEPLVDATLPDGSRLQASLSRAVTTRGSTFTIRRFKEEPFTPTDLLRFGTASAEVMAYLWLAVEHGASAIVCGGTASGKTTTLNAVSLFIPPDKKIISIEDTREINLTHENWIPGLTRSASSGAQGSDGKRLGEVDMFDLLKAALRQRPEYLILGEVRGREASVLFQAMATGHTAYSTMHADGVASAVHRLESKPIEVPRNMLTSLRIVVIQAPARVNGQRVRRIREVSEITGLDQRTNELLSNRLFQWDPASDAFSMGGTSAVLKHIAMEQGLSDTALREEYGRRVRLLKALAAANVRTIDAFSHALARYAVDPEATVREVESRAGG